jgi:hypothetical protein
LKKILIATLVVASGGLAANQIIKTNAVQEKVDEYVTKFNKSENAVISHGDYGINLAQQAYIKDVKIIDTKSKSTVNLGNVYINSMDSEHEIPHYLDLNFENIQINIEDINSKDKKFNKLLKSVSIDNKIEAAISFSYKYEEKNNNDFTFKIGQEVKNIGGLDLSFNIDSLKLAELEANKAKYEKQPMSALAVLSEIQLKNISIDFTDHKITQTILEEVAKEQSKIKTAADAEAELIKNIEKEKTRPKFEIAHYDEIIKAVKNKKGFTLSLIAKPMPVTQLYMAAMQEMNTNKDKSIDSIDIVFKAK